MLLLTGDEAVLHLLLMLDFNEAGDRGAEEAAATENMEGCSGAGLRALEGFRTPWSALPLLLPAVGSMSCTLLLEAPDRDGSTYCDRLLWMPT